MVKENIPRVSGFAHSFDLGEHVALWHSLRMKPVFIEKSVYEDFRNGVITRELEAELLTKKILLAYDGEDNDVLNRFRNAAPAPDPSIAYFILSDKCNLACRYCFVGSDSCNEGLSFKKDMTREVADKSLDAFARQLEASDTDYTKTASDIIFFGGEPLVNYEVLLHVAKRVNELRDKRAVFSNTNLSVITNGTLLNAERIKTLDSLGVAVSISIDGFSEHANEMRVDKAGNSTFGRVIEVLECYKQLNVPMPSLSVTLSDSAITDLSGMMNLVREYDIKGLGYNVLLKRDEADDPTSYYESASQFIIDSFQELRDRGVYEDRIMRKLNAFAHARVHFSDCGATAGGQILFAPDGRIGICQGLLADEENYVSSVWNENFIAADSPTWKEWATLIPLNNEKCLSCEALGICGGGCPINARLCNPEEGLNCIDERSCIHAKRTLRFLLEDLYLTSLNRGA